MKLHFYFYMLLGILILLLTDCTTSKNTWLTRDTNAFATRYNIYFNAYQSFLEGIDKIDNAQKDTYTHLIPMFPISIHENAKAATSDMDYTIEKCRKAIKLHSIRIKPERNYEKAKDPAYIAFMNKEEYNPMVIKSWLLLAKAEFYKTDFAGAIGTYTYIIDHYGTDKEVKNESEIGIARCYTEINSFYEAENALNNVKTENPNSKSNGMYAAAMADLMIREKKYPNAIPFLSIAIDHADNKFLKQRFLFLSGELALKNHNYQSAYTAFTNVIHSNPPYEMQFAAQLLRAQSADQSQQKKEIDELTALLRSPKNAAYLDQIYVALGNIYLSDAKNDQAIKCYRKAIDNIQQNTPDQTTPYIKLANLYFNQKEYLRAQPYYAAAAKLIKQNDANFDQVRSRSTILNTLASYHENILLQDSLLHLAQLPEKERLIAIEKLIAEKKQANIKAAKKAAETKRQAAIAAAQNGFLPDRGTPNFSIPSNNNAWYFYNPVAVASGKEQFQEKWGTRTLSDNWRLNSQAAVAVNPNATSSSQTDTVQHNMSQNSPEFYLAQLPLTKAAMATSNHLIGNDLLQMGFLYETQLNDLSMAIKTYEELINRFPPDSAWLDGYYSLYLLYKQQGETAKAAHYKTLIITNFKDTRYAQQLMHPEYQHQQAEINAQENMLYEATFKAFMNGDFSKAIANIGLAEKQYPYSNLMPKFELINAICLGKTGDKERMKTTLHKLIQQYPESDVTVTARNLIALLDQGKQVPAGGSIRTSFPEYSSSSLKATIDTLSTEYTLADNGHDLILITIPSDSVNINELLYKVASFNFSHFMLQDFDLQILRLGVNMRFIIVSDFNNYNNAIYYEQLLNTDMQLRNTFSQAHVNVEIISNDNLTKLLANGNLNNYIRFYNTKLLPKFAKTNDNNNSESQTSVQPNNILKSNTLKQTK
ncbi:tetratricopeptide repeat protein [Microbacter margulisiae]|uniref:Tetratricopeptide (TPR) repeat protein n=1 Tax=Microbacter margulisiae TaxID=1350067 RepID=A0A7W5H0S0_9PORP|nr:tetratricopeptide repeat protein [Microbacter margulisiae]MBB3185854.1 tetratricopeptide (TPR) repeat protein [Microbacter margulisiae]